MDDQDSPPQGAPRRLKPMQGVPLDRRRLLGQLLEARRGELGHLHRTTFTAEHHLGWRTVTDIENGYRDTFTRAILTRLAGAYGVTYPSVMAVLRGEADELEPAGGQDTARGRVPVTDAFGVLAGPGLDHYRYVTAADLAAKPPRLRSATERKIMSSPDRLVSMDQKCEIIAGLRWGLDMAGQQGESSG